MKKIFFNLVFLIFGQINFGQHHLPIDSAGLYKLIDFKGNSVTSWKAFDDVQIFESPQLYRVNYINRWGIADEKLEIKINTKYDTLYKVDHFIFGERPGHLDIYTNQFVLLKTIENFERIEVAPYLNEFYGKQKLKYIVHTYDNTFVTDSSFKFKDEFTFSDAFYNDSIIYFRKNDNYGFISTKDKLIKGNYISIARAHWGIIETKDTQSKHHYFLFDGRQIPDSDSVLIIDNVSASYKIYQNGKGNLMDIDGKSLVQHSGSDIFGLLKLETNEKNKAFYAVNKSGKIGLINGNGKLILPYAYDHITAINESRFIVMMNNKFGLIDITGKFLLDTNYTFIEKDNKGTLILYKYDSLGLADLDGKIILPVKFKELHNTGSGLVVRENGRLGLFDYSGKRILNSEWVNYYYDDEYLRFTRADKICLANEKGVYTPLDCKRISTSTNVIKYYRENEMVICYVENGIKKDSNVFHAEFTMEVAGDYDYIKGTTDHYNCATFLSQTNSKFGSKEKKDTGFAVLPTYHSIWHLTYNDFVKISDENVFIIGEISFRTKETIVPFGGASCATYKPEFAYLSSSLSVPWGATNIDPVYLTNGTFTYHSDNVLQPQEPTVMFSQNGYTAVSITDGTLNLSQGQETFHYRDYYNQMNSYFNLTINNSSTFSLLSSSPMLYVSKPTWHVLELERDVFVTKKLGSFFYYKEYDTGLAVFSTDGQFYGIHYKGAGQVAPEIFSQIIVTNDSFRQYFIVAKKQDEIDGTSSIVWTAYTGEGQYLPKYYDKVEMLHSGYFIVTEGQKRYVTNKSGKSIYPLN